MTKTLEEIEQLVSKVAREAYEDDAINFNDRVDALRVLAPYYSALRKTVAPVTEDGASTMSDFAELMHEEKHARPNPQVRGDRGRQ